MPVSENSSKEDSERFSSSLETNEARMQSPDSGTPLSPLQSLMIPEWTSDDEDSDCDTEKDECDSDGIDLPVMAAIHESRHPPCSSERKGQYESTTTLERLGPDTSAGIFQFLSVQELSKVSKVSKILRQSVQNPSVWKGHFQRRWKYEAPQSSPSASASPSASTSFDWYRAYQQAYLNPHDLWITHWNCVDPIDALGPGRCCIDTETHPLPPPSSDEGLNTDSRRYCPTCRYHPCRDATSVRRLDPNIPITTPAQAIAAATELRLMQAEDRSLTMTKYSSRRARKSFSMSSTLHRKISTKQYEANALHFLSDLLFFQVHDSEEELLELKHLFPNDPQKDHGSGTAIHSWHSCHFANPDLTRPLVWRISIMRKDCFTAYPTEGYLEPGEAQVVVFGVKPFGSLLAHATHQLNAHREGVDTFWANVYTEEAHLPPSPFLIHYHYGGEEPGDKESTSEDAREDNPQTTHAQELNPAAIARARPLHPQDHHSLSNLSGHGNPTISLGQARTPWKRSGKRKQPLRIMHLSAHVNANFTLRDFRRRTVLPFSIRDSRTSVVCAPQLSEFHPSVYQILENLELERTDSYKARAYRMEAPCHACGVTWGARAEELGQAFVLSKLESEYLVEKRNQALRHINRLLRKVIDEVSFEGTWMERHYDLCFQIHTLCVDYRGSPWLTTRQQEILMQWEAIIDLLYRRHSNTPGGEAETNLYFMVPWRHAGIYENAICTDSIYDNRKKSASLDNRDSFTLWKEEPKYLEAFAHLAHSPGRFCLGPQEDPNHLRAKPNGRYGRRQRGLVTDMFFDAPVYGLQAALCVVSDPRSLMVHGIWDRAAYPGTLVRRPRIPVLPALAYQGPPLKIHLTKLITSSNKLLYFELQDALDMEALLLIDSMCRMPSPHLSKRLVSPISFRNILANVPAPGAGRFALSSIGPPDESGRRRVVNVDIYEENFSHNSYLHEMDPSRPNFSGNSNDEDDGRGRFGPPQRVHGIDPRPGAHILNLIWVLSAHLGWTVDNNEGAASVYVDRRILIGAQWLSISLMAAPMFYTLFARYALWIPARPIDYSLEALPFKAETQLRFLTEKECGYVSGVLFLSWLSLGRWIERYTSRDFFRGMLEHLPASETQTDGGLLHRLQLKFKLWCQRLWDAVCPLFLQRLVFVPKWNRRSQEELLKHVAFWRSSQLDGEKKSTFRAISGGGFVFVDDRDGQIHLGDVSWTTKVVIGTLVTLASFSSSSPHFFLNLLTVFSSSISLVRPLFFEFCT